MSKPTLLVPVVFPEPGVYPLDSGNIVGLDGFDVVLFGYWELPEGVSRATVRANKETQAQAILHEMAAAFSRAGASTSVRLHFGRGGSEEVELQERIADETDADAVMMGGHITMWNNVLVPLRDDRHWDDLLEFLAGLETDSIFTLELYHVPAEPSAVEAGQDLLDSLRADLVENGFPEDVVEVTVEIREDASEAIAERAQRHNLVVMGETEERPSESEFLGPVYHTLADQTDVPIVVLRD